MNGRFRSKMRYDAHFNRRRRLEAAQPLPVGREGVSLAMMAA